MLVLRTKAHHNQTTICTSFSATFCAVAQPSFVDQLGSEDTSQHEVAAPFLLSKKTLNPTKQLPRVERQRGWAQKQRKLMLAAWGACTQPAFNEELHPKP